MDHRASTDNNVRLPGVERVREDVQTAHHHCRVTSCERNIYCRRGKRFKAKGAHEDTDRGNLTKERNPVSDKSCQLTEQAGKDRRWEQNWTKSFRENKELKKSKVSKEIRKGLRKENFFTAKTSLNIKIPTMENTDYTDYVSFLLHSTWWPSPSLCWRHIHSCSGSCWAWTGSTDSGFWKFDLPEEATPGEKKYRYETKTSMITLFKVNSTSGSRPWQRTWFPGHEVICPSSHWWPWPLDSQQCWVAKSASRKNQC